MSVLSFDPQASGWLDDGTESGVVRTKPVRGDLVPTPFRQGHYAVESTGSTVSYQFGLFYNTDGTGTGINVVVPSTAGGAGVRIWQPFYGRAFGVRWRRTSITSDLTVTVDGNAVHVDGAIKTLAAEGQHPSTNVALALTHDDMSDGLHVAEILIANPVSGSNTVTLLGFLAERRAGYTEPTKTVFPQTPAALTTSQVAFAGTGGNDTNYGYFSHVDYVNTSASSVTITIQVFGVTAYSLVLTAAGTAGCSATYAPPKLVNAYSASWTHAASAATSVNATVYGGII